MPLVDQVSADLKTAMLARDTARTGALRMIKAAFIELAKSGDGAVTEERAMDGLRRLKKQREDSITAYVGAGREDLAGVERAELLVIEGYLPKLADEAQTLLWAQEAVAASGASKPGDLGKAMGALMKAHKSDVDGTLARTLLSRLLGA